MRLVCAIACVLVAMSCVDKAISTDPILFAKEAMWLWHVIAALWAWHGIHVLFRGAP